MFDHGFYLPMEPGRHIPDKKPKKRSKKSTLEYILKNEYQKLDKVSLFKV